MKYSHGSIMSQSPVAICKSPGMYYVNTAEIIYVPPVEINCTALCKPTVDCCVTVKRVGGDCVMTSQYNRSKIKGAQSSASCLPIATCAVQLQCLSLRNKGT